MKYAGFWLQIAAGLLDVVCLSLMLLVLFTGMLFCVSLILDLPWAGLQELLRQRGWGLRRLLELSFLVVMGWFYLYVIYKRKASLGQLTFHLRVVMRDGSAMTLRALILRKMVFLSICTTYVLGMFVSGVVNLLSHTIVTAFTLLLVFAWYFANCVVMLSNERGRSLEEWMADTVVIHVHV